MSEFDKNTTASGEDTGFNIDHKRILYQIVRYWYLIVLSLVVCLTIAFLFNRYATRVYSIEASIIIKEAEDGSGGGLLYNNPLVRLYRNYLNELYIIKSTPLMERTVSQLHFENSFYRIGNVLTSEQYKDLPFKIAVLKNEKERQFSFTFEVKNEQTYTLYFEEEEDEITKREATFGDIVKFNGVEFTITKIPSKLDIDGELVGVSWMYTYKPTLTVARQYQSRLQADWAEEGAGVINLSLKGSNPEKEIDFLTGLIENYQEYDLEKKNLTASNTVEFITEQLNNISDSLTKVERQLELFKDKNIVTDLNSEALRLYQKMEGLEIQKTDLVIRDSYYDYLTTYISKSGDLDQVILPSSVGIDDPILSVLVSQMIAIQTEVKLSINSEKLQNPLVVEKRREIEQIKGDILESVKNQKSIDKIKLDFLSKGIRELEGQLSYLPIAERQLVVIKRNYSLLENLYIFLLQKRAEAGISKAASTSDIVVVNPPMSSGAISPSITRNLLIGASAGFTIPLFIFVLLELLNTRVQSREDIEKFTTIPFIGGVGHKRSDYNLEIFTRPKSSISESFRALRSNLNYFLEGKDNGVFLTTSSISGEGKTFTSVNLAAVFALSGKRTLIVGADMRKPKIFSDFGLENNVGLSSYLAGLKSFKEVVQATEYDNLHLVSGGPVPPNPSELLLSTRMIEFIAQAKQEYDFIFIDSPPLAIVTDAFVLSALVDHTLFIIRQNYSPKNLLKTIQDFYAAGKIKKISIVLNDIYRSGPGYGYGYGYAYGYGYGYGYVYGKKEKVNGYYEE